MCFIGEGVRRKEVIFEKESSSALIAAIRHEPESTWREEIKTLPV